MERWMVRERDTEGQREMEGGREREERVETKRDRERERWKEREKRERKKERNRERERIQCVSKLYLLTWDSHFDKSPVLVPSLHPLKTSSMSHDPSHDLHAAISFIAPSFPTLGTP